MTKIMVKPDCGNSPKAAFIRDFETAFAESKSEVILNSISDDIHWEMVGETAINGKDNVKDMLKDMLDGTMAELLIENIITHGDAGSANGTITFKDGKRFAFCDVFTFTAHGPNAKIKTLTSYVIEIDK